MKPNRITNDKDKHKIAIEFGQPEHRLIANKKMRIYSPASIAANPMLAVRALYILYVTKPKNLLINSSTRLISV